ncbi:MAG: tRNA (guanosine(46)-N7)-methyltransferase TrmB [Ferrovum sp.]|nr:tRNA (guanosine(46)-N7)-methyltransferase TrmB [Ferrovum sp.]NDU87551.1 tRNA (guanosine(46)-N7)-methyltransferase TrmB [Ferrovum sp.]
MDHRPIRSFVLRQGRFSPAQQRALDLFWPQWGVEYAADSPLSASRLESLYGRQAPLIVEIGFGMGEGTIALALQRPDWNFLAIDVHGPGVGGLLKKIAENGLTNVRVMRHDAVEVLTHSVLPETLDGIHVFFPDPWPKARHHKRRLIQEGFVRVLAQRLKSGGYMHLATDWQDYAEQMLAVLRAEPLLCNRAPENFVERPETRPLTRFEARGMRLGHGVWDLWFERRISGGK